MANDQQNQDRQTQDRQDRDRQDRDRQDEDAQASAQPQHQADPHPDVDGLADKKPDQLTPDELRLMADTMPGEGPGDD